MKRHRRARDCTLVKSVPAATDAVSRQQCSRSPFTSCNKQRAVCAASSLDGASTTAPGPFGSALGTGTLGSALGLPADPLSSADPLSGAVVAPFCFLVVFVVWSVPASVAVVLIGAGCECWCRC